MRFATMPVLFTALILGAGCGGDKAAGGATDKAGEAAKADKAQPAAPAVDTAAAKQLLQGDWSVKTPKGKEIFKVKVHGDEVEVTDLRFSEPKTQKGTLVIKRDHELGVKGADGTTYKYAYAKIGDTLHLGMGTVLKADNLDAFELEVAMGEKIVKDAKGCRWVKNFAGKNESRDIKCEVADKDGKKVLKYQVPDSFEPTKLSDRELYVFGDVLIDQELLDSVAHKQ